MGNFKEIVKNAENKIGVYIVSLDNNIMYIGRAIEDRANQSTKGLRKRLQEHYRGANNAKEELFLYRDEINVEVIICNLADKAKELEAKLIREHNTVQNGWNDKYEN